MTEQITLQSGREYTMPALFPNPQTGPEAEYIRKVLTRYDVDTLEGVVVNIKDWYTAGKELQIRQSSLNGRGVEDTALVVNPDFSPLFGYSQQSKAQKLAELNIFPPNTSRVVNELYNTARERKREVRKQDVHPTVEDLNVIRDVMQFQIDRGADIVAAPSIPITTRGDFEDRIELAKSINKTSKGIVDGGLLSEELDLMHILSLSPSIMEMPEDTTATEKRWDRAIDTSIKYDPDVIGVHIQQMHTDDRVQNENLLHAISKIDQRTNAPIFLLNVREFGIVSLVYGIDVVSPPIARYPYFRRSSEPPQTSYGKYYHPEELQDHSREELRNDLRSNNYRFPCYCEICRTHERITEVDDEDWNEFRRIHYLLIKNSEMKQMRENDKLLSEALRDKLGNSTRTNLVAYLP